MNGIIILQGEKSTMSRGKPVHPVLGQNDQRNQKEKIIVQTRPCKVRFLCHACEVVVWSVIM